MTNINFDDVMRLARQWYYSEIREIADSAIKSVNADTNGDDDHEAYLQTFVDAVTDEHQFVTFTVMAGMVCAVSDNDSAYTDELGEKPPLIEAQACFAMRADVWELLNARRPEWRYY